MAADQRICQIPLMRRARILLALPPEGVLVGAANAGKVDLHDDRPWPRIRHCKFAQRNATGLFGDGGADHGHASILLVLGRALRAAAGSRGEALDAQSRARMPRLSSKRPFLGPRRPVAVVGLTSLAWGASVTV